MRASRDNPLTPEAANRIYDILVNEAGASENSRPGFVYAQTHEHVTEWRFMGDLGFGGKFWRAPGRRLDGSYGEMWYVNLYSEDLTESRAEKVRVTNLALDELRKELS